jgi:hypothetical protein
MLRYFIHLHNGTGETHDEDGVELADLAAAERVAVQGVRSILSEEVMSGTLDLRGRAEIANAEGEVLQTVQFAETILVYRAERP